MAHETNAAITLASASPQRLQLLREINLPVICRPQNVDESLISSRVEDEVIRLAALKADSCRRQGEDHNWILAADTVVAVDGMILGKPENRSEAAETLTRIAGKTHRVVSGLVLHDCRNDASIDEIAVTRVSFASMSLAEIEWYLDSGEWLGAAGGYRIQRRGGLFIRSIEGSYHNVVGLPIDVFYGMLTKFNYPFP